MNKPSRHWERYSILFRCAMFPRHYAGKSRNPRLLCSISRPFSDFARAAGGRARLGSDTGYGAIWLSQRGCVAEGITRFAGVFVERARQVNNIAGGEARFRVAGSCSTSSTAGTTALRAPIPLSTTWGCQTPNKTEPYYALKN